MGNIKSPLLIMSIFLWIGFVCAISFMEAWLKFQAPGITLPLGLGIGRLVFNALNKVEWVFALVSIFCLIKGSSHFKSNRFLFVIPLLILIVQSVWLLPVLDYRAQLHIDGAILPSSAHHIYYVAAETLKVICLLWFGMLLFNPPPKKKKNCMKNLNEETVGTIVAENFKTAAIFQKYKIDFCCKGNISLREACAASHANETDVVKEIKQVLLEQEAAINDYNNWPLDLLADYIEKKHHRFVTAQIPVIKGFLDKIVNVHGGRHPELTQVRELFNQSADELSHHMVKEEKILFPSVKEMIQSSTTQQPYAPFFGTIKNPVAVMMSEHENEGDRFREISQLTNNYTPPADACTTYRVAFESLKEFEKDLHTHIHLENNILFPKALDMEGKINLN